VTSGLAGIRYIIFDLDGTLVDSSEGVVIATNYALTKIGEPSRRPEEIIPFIGCPLEDMFQAFSEGEYEEFWRYFQEKGETAIASTTHMIGAADEVLRDLHRKKYIMGIGTTKMRIHVAKILARLNWEELISAYVGADDVARVKPAPDAFLKTMAALGGNKSNSLVVGDTINDVFAAKAAGLPIVAVKSPFGRKNELEQSNPDFLLESLADLPALLNHG